VNALKLTVLGLAAARLTRLVVDDEITAPVRDKIYDLRTPGPGRRFTSAWDKVDDAVNCHACTSVWAGAAVTVAEHGGPVGRFLVRTLALSQAALAVKALIDKVERS
jgi:hypothetical protein